MAIKTKSRQKKFDTRIDFEHAVDHLLYVVYHHDQEPDAPDRVAYQREG